MVSGAHSNVPRLLGRTAEYDRLHGALGTARDGLSDALVLVGEPGIGKTALLRQITADAAGFRLAQISGIQAEASMPFAGLHRLLVPFLDRTSRLPGPQRIMLEGAFGLGPQPQVTERFLVGLATLSMLADAALDEPLLCIVDDAQWIDAESIETLAFVARRLHADRIAMLFSVREPDPRGALFEGVAQIALRGLAPEVGLALLADSVDAPIRPAVAERIVAETGGNPLAIVELARGLTPEELSGSRLLPSTLPVTRQVEVSFLRQIERLPPEARTLLLVASAEASADPSVVFAALEVMGVDPSAAAGEIIDELLELRPQVVFRHPIVRSVVYQSALASQRRAVHAALADVLKAPDQADRRAWHRGAAALGPDESTASELEQAAARARGRGGPVIEAQFLRRSGELSTDPAVAAGRWLGAAEAALRAGDVAQADECLTLSSPVGSNDATTLARRRRLEGALALQQGRHADAVALLFDAARILGSDDSIGRRDALLEAMDVLVTARLVAQPGVGDDPALLGAFLELAQSDAKAGELADLMLEGFALRLTLGHREAAPALRSALMAMDNVVDGDQLIAWPLLGFFAALEMWDADRLASWTARVVEASRQAGAIHVLRIMLMTEATAHVIAGRFDRAAACHAEHAALTTSLGGHAEFYRFHELELSAWQGDDAATLHQATEMVDAHDANPSMGSLVYVASNALGVLHLGAGRYDEAIGPLRRIFDGDPPRYGGPALPDLIEAAVRGGDLELGATALARLEQRAAATDTPWVRGLLARSQALVATDANAEAHFREAIASLAETPARTDLARAHLLYGEWLRRQKRRADARMHLQTASDLFLDMGAAGFAERARVELVATGARPRRRSVGHNIELTPQESHIARLATRGMTNREIASQLFLSPSTIEYHLAHVFQKLGVTSRRDLALVLPESDSELVPGGH